MVIGQDDVVSPQLLAERSHEDGIRVEVYATVLEQNIRSPNVTDMRQISHSVSEYLYHIQSRNNSQLSASVSTVLRCESLAQTG